MILESQVVSLELAKKLKELGVKQESRWDWVRSSTTGRYKLVIIGGRGNKGFTDYICAGRDNKFGEIYSAFTVAELGEMLILGIFSRKTHKKGGTGILGFICYNANLFKIDLYVSVDMYCSNDQ